MTWHPRDFICEWVCEGGEEWLLKMVLILNQTWSQTVFLQTNMTKMKLPRSSFITSKNLFRPRKSVRCLFSYCISSHILTLIFSCGSISITNLLLFHIPVPRHNFTVTLAKLLLSISSTDPFPSTRPSFTVTHTSQYLLDYFAKLFSLIFGCWEIKFWWMNIYH